MYLCYGYGRRQDDMTTFVHETNKPRTRSGKKFKFENIRHANTRHDVIIIIIRVGI